MRKQPLLQALIIVAMLAAFAAPSSAADVNGCPFVQPFFGRTECEPISSVPAANSYSSKIESGLFWSAWHWFEACGNDENSPQCNYVATFKNIKGESFFSDFFSNVGEIKYRYCKVMWDTSSCDSTWTRAFGPFSTSGSNAAARINAVPIQAKSDKPVIEVWIGRPWIGGDDIEAKLLSEYLPYGLTVYDSGAKSLYNVKSCNINDLSFKDAGNICLNSLTGGPLGGTGGGFVSPTCQAILGKTGLGLDIRNSQRLEFDDWVNYVSTFVFAPADINNKVITWKGQQVYLQAVSGGVNIYSLEKLNVKSGACYTVPTKTIANDGSITCIPGQQTANAICVQEGDRTFFKPLTAGECSTNAECASKLSNEYVCINSKCVLGNTACFTDLQCPGGGSFTTDTAFSTPTVSKWACRSSVCTKIESKGVQCTLPATGCASGSFCDPATFTCVGQTGPTQPPLRQFDFGRFFGNLIGALLISGVVILILFALGFFVPGAGAVTGMLRNKFVLLAAWVVLALAIVALTGGFSG